jgi:hypothetical protein
MLSLLGFDPSLLFLLPLSGLFDPIGSFPFLAAYSLHFSDTRNPYGASLLDKEAVDLAKKTTLLTSHRREGRTLMPLWGFPRAPALVGSHIDHDPLVRHGQSGVHPQLPALPPGLDFLGPI